MNLNQSLALSYVRNAIQSHSASKRQRPIEDGDADIENDSDVNRKLDKADSSDSTFVSNKIIDINKSYENQINSNHEYKDVKKKVVKKKLHIDNKSNDNLNDSIKNNIEDQSKIKSFLSPRPANRLSDLAGIEKILTQIRELVFYPLQYNNIYSHLGVNPPCGLLLHGPSGCGKTSLANAIAGELNIPYYKASGPDLVGGTTGESEEKVRELFKYAISNAPSIIFIDAIDVIAGKKDMSQRGMDRRLVAQLADSIDSVIMTGDIKLNNELASPQSAEFIDNSSSNKLVILIVATNKPDSIDPTVRGRFAREISLPVPDAPSRTKILTLMTSQMRLAEFVDLVEIGKLTPGFVGADLQALVREAGMIAVSRIISTVQSNEDTSYIHSNGYVEMNDFIKAAKTVQPTAKREGFAVVPNVSWDDVGALSEVREELLHNVIEPISHPERFKSLGLEVPAGVLFFGPPGCGKTLLAKALANQSGANFISVKGPELLNMYVGESESRVRQVFNRARASVPCVIFFDELDALCPKRGSGGNEGSNVSERVVNQLLTELDGLEVRKDVYVIAATNRLELIDDAMLRPGRLGKLLYVPLPSPSDRVAILKALIAKNVTIDNGSEDSKGVDIDLIGHDPRADGFSGADLSALVREAGLAVIREWRDNIKSDVESSRDINPVICSRHFESAFTKVRSSVSIQDRKRYERVHQNIKSGMGAIQALSEASKYISTKNNA
eukprot:gene19028-24848_t